MSCSTREDWAQALGALGESVSRLLELTADTLTSPELLTTLGELEVQCRRLPVAGNLLINQLASQATPADLGGTLAMRWPIGCGWSRTRPTAASRTPPTWDRAAH